MLNIPMRFVLYCLAFEESGMLESDEVSVVSFDTVTLFAEYYG